MLIVVNLHAIRILLNPGDKSFIDQIALPARDAEDEVIQRRPAEDVDVVA